ncbi:FGGY-family pentulose kinase [Hypoxylon cercidicola]|nr:FGGY-family pentulose kinase [Hypoxylon cercidicola]
MDSDPLLYDLKYHHIGVDVGTGSARALIIDENGKSIASAFKDIDEWQPQPGIHEQSVSQIWNSVCYAVKEALSQSGIQPESVRSIAFAATCSLALFTHDTNEPVAASGRESADQDHNVILWMDQRAKLEAEAINKTQHELLKYFGGSISVLMELPKILWLKHHMSEANFRRCKFYDLSDALTYVATRNQRFPCTENCTRDALQIGVDGTAKGWSREFLEAVELEILAAEKFKRIGGVCRHGRAPPAGISAGHLCEMSARDLGLKPDVTVGVGTIDSYCGWVGTAGLNFDGQQNFPLHSRMAVVAGTSACYIVASRKPVFVEGIWGPYQDWVLPGYWMSEGGQVATGMLLEHVIEIHPAYDAALKLANNSDLSIYDFLDRHLEHMRSKTGAPDISYLGRNYFYYGDLFGNRSPIADPSMTGSVVGLTGDKSIDNLAIQYYGVLEFIALQMRHTISKMNEAGTEVNSLCISGSVANNANLMRLVATSCDMPVVIPRQVGAAVCFGAAILGATAIAKTLARGAGSLWSVMQDLSQQGEIRQPEKNALLKDLLDVKYVIYLEQCERQRVFRDMVEKAVSSHMERPA